MKYLFIIALLLIVGCKAGPENPGLVNDSCYNAAKKEFPGDIILPQDGKSHNSYIVVDTVKHTAELIHFPSVSETNIALDGHYKTK